MTPEIVDVDVNLDMDGDYERCITDLREKLAHHPQRQEYIDRHGAWLENHPLLPVQQYQPARWMHINIVAWDKRTRNTMRTTLAVRDDNVYLIGFKNGSGKWYEFGKEGSSRFIEGSIFLGCYGSYQALFHKSGYDLENLSVGKNAAIDAVRTLSGYERGVPAEAATRVHLARLCVMICESARMMPLYDIVTEGWNHMGTKISAEHVWCIKSWNRMSRKLLNTWDPSPERHRLLAVVHLLLNFHDDINGIEEHQQEQSAPPGADGSSQQWSGSSNTQQPETSSWRPASSGSGGGAQEQKGLIGGQSVHENSEQ